MSKKNKTKSTAVKYENPGRPKYQPVFPRSKQFSFIDLKEVNPETTVLTLRKYIERDRYFHKPGSRPIAKTRTKANPKSVLILIDGETCEPNSKSGLGRRGLLYSLRANADVKRATSTKTPKTKVVSQTPTADALDKIHAALAAPSAPVTVEAVTIKTEVAPVTESVQNDPPVTKEEAPVTETKETVPVTELVNS